jgi:hypothetical protein
MARTIPLMLLFVLGGLVSCQYIDAQNEQRVYDFCNRWSPTNPLETILREVSDDFVISDDQNNRLLYITKPTQWPFLPEYSCQIHYQQQRVVSLAVVKQFSF